VIIASSVARVDRWFPAAVAARAGRPGLPLRHRAVLVARPQPVEQSIFARLAIYSCAAMGAPIQMLWVEGRLSRLERLSMTSFMRCGHPVPGELGPSLLTVMVRKHGLDHLLAPPWRFPPLGWWEFPRLVEDTILQWPDATLAVHCFDEMWRRAGLNKSTRYGVHSPFELLQARYLPAADDAAAQGDVSSAPKTGHGGT